MRIEARYNGPARLRQRRLERGDLRRRGGRQRAGRGDAAPAAAAGHRADAGRRRGPRPGRRAGRPRCARPELGRCRRYPPVDLATARGRRGAATPAWSSIRSPAVTSAGRSGPTGCGSFPAGCRTARTAAPFRAPAAGERGHGLGGAGLPRRLGGARARPPVRAGPDRRRGHGAARAGRRVRGDRGVAAASRGARRSCTPACTARTARLLGRGPGNLDRRADPGSVVRRDESPSDPATEANVPTAPD